MVQVADQAPVHLDDVREDHLERVQPAAVHHELRADTVVQDPKKTHESILGLWKLVEGGKRVDVRGGRRRDPP